MRLQPPSASPGGGPPSVVVVVEVVRELVCLLEHEPLGVLNDLRRRRKARARLAGSAATGHGPLRARPCKDRLRTWTGPSPTRSSLHQMVASSSGSTIPMIRESVAHGTTIGFCSESPSWGQESHGHTSQPRPSSRPATPARPRECDTSPCRYSATPRRRGRTRASAAPSRTAQCPWRARNPGRMRPRLPSAGDERDTFETQGGRGGGPSAAPARGATCSSDSFPDGLTALSAKERPHNCCGGRRDRKRVGNRPASPPRGAGGSTGQTRRRAGPTHRRRAVSPRTRGSAQRCQERNE